MSKTNDFPLSSSFFAASISWKDIFNIFKRSFGQFHQMVGLAESNKTFNNFFGVKKNSFLKVKENELKCFGLSRTTLNPFTKLLRS